LFGDSGLAQAFDYGLKLRQIRMRPANISTTPIMGCCSSANPAGAARNRRRVRDARHLRVDGRDPDLNAGVSRLASPALISIVRA
jgi:hypothetical protein